MDQVQRSYRLYPSGSGSTTLNIYFMARANENVGSYGGLSAMPGLSAINNYSIVFATGYNESVKVSDIFEQAIQYLLNMGVDKWFSPKNGFTVREALVKAFEACGFATGQGSITLFFNGQFGTVLAS